MFASHVQFGRQVYIASCKCLKHLAGVRTTERAIYELEAGKVGASKCLMEVNGYVRDLANLGANYLFRSKLHVN